MFHTLETTWNHSARRRWTAAASFTMQAIGVSILLFVPFLTVQGPPKLLRMNRDIFSPPLAPHAPIPPGPRHFIRGSEVNGLHIIAPPSIPDTANPIVDRGGAVTPAPDLDNMSGIQGVTGTGRPGVPGGFGDTVAPPPQPVVDHPIRVSNWSEGNVIRRIQPAYPTLARQARIQGPVQLRAIISRTGTIENLSVLSGHAMLVTAAVGAVKQWRYRPYLLNGEPVEVETEITVNFTLTGN